MTAVTKAILKMEELVRGKEEDFKKLKYDEISLKSQLLDKQKAMVKIIEQIDSGQRSEALNSEIFEL